MMLLPIFMVNCKVRVIVMDQIHFDLVALVKIGQCAIGLASHGQNWGMGNIVNSDDDDDDCRPARTAR